jgi:hypothetical protein
MNNKNKKSKEASLWVKYYNLKNPSHQSIKVLIPQKALVHFLNNNNTNLQDKIIKRIMQQNKKINKKILRLLYFLRKII